MNLNNWQTQLRKGLLELVILNMLSKDTCHGYQMVQVLKTIEGMKIREGNIYPILARLGTDGVIQSEKKPSPDGPPRKYYELTAKGKETLIEMNGHWEMIQQSIEQIRKGNIQ
jgi:PadR family transcriptional regulator PadR